MKEQNMKLALCSGSFSRDILAQNADIYSCLDLAVELGFSGFEVRQDLLKNVQEDLAKLKQRCIAENIEVVYSAMLWPVQPDISALNSTLLSLQQAIDNAAKLEAKLLKTGFGPISQVQELTNAHYDTLRNVGDYARERGITLCLENSDKPATSAPELLKTALYTLNHSNIRLTLDIGNLSIAGYDPIAGTALLADKTAYVHIKDHIEGSGPTFLGNGCIDFSVAIAALTEKGYNNLLCFEFPMSLDKLSEIKASILYMQQRSII
jgi:sugar phosphate isomerase/epimerase